MTKWLSDKEEMIFAFHGYPSEAKQKEETLSDHAEKVYEDVWYPEKDVKEAVQKLKEANNEMHKETGVSLDVINQIFGPKLTNGNL